MLKIIFEKVNHHIWVSYLDQFRNEYIIARQFAQDEMLVDMLDIKNDKVPTVIEASEADEPIAAPSDVY